ncbi:MULTISPECIES: tetratricopeptide repeat protein [Bradyrhizobium]|nr:MULTISPECIES: tetratricopeptide repeat protein [Bradyrhizobium]MBM7484442.1 tetratricopeptide (TPR) repeat protein [Bradyrhizobium canariense]WOH60810.1 tetratricopeptide repeat protein [Bradyrhizobium sp. BWC-3-1]
MILLLAAPASAQKPEGQFRNVELCNAASSPDRRIEACSAFIAAGRGGPQALAMAHNNRGIAYAAKVDYDRAVADFEAAIGIDPTFAKPVNNRGAARLRTGDYDAAMEDFDRAIALQPAYPGAFVNRAEGWLKKGDLVRAESDYTAATRLNADMEVAWSGLCWIRASTGDPQGAVEACDKAIGSGAHTAATYDSRALAHLKAGRTDAAIADYDAALRIDPTLATALYGRGRAKIRRGETASGEADVAAAKAVRGDIAEEFARYGVP